MRLGTQLGLIVTDLMVNSLISQQATLPVSSSKAEWNIFIL